MSKRKYKALVLFQGHEPGQEFEADFDPWLAKQFQELGQIEPAKGEAKKEKEGN